MREPSSDTWPDFTTDITWIGHSTVLIRSNDTYILTDPVLRSRVAHLRRCSPLLEADWPSRVDCILISHLHYDHCDLPTLRRFGHYMPMLVPVGAGAWLRRHGFRHVEETRIGSRVTVDGVSITAVPANHSGQRPPFGPTAEAIGFIIDGNHRIYYPGDTDIFPEMAEFSTDLDCALMPVWGWGPSLGPGHLNPARAAEALRLIEPRLAIPIHWGTYHPYGTAIRDRRFLEDPPWEFQRLATLHAPEVDIHVVPPTGHLSIDSARVAGDFRQ